MTDDSSDPESGMGEAAALALATEAHAGQTDKADRPYIEHPKRVAARLQTSDEKVVALLHDVLEDTEVTVEHLRARGASDEQTNALIALTHMPDESQVAYCSRVAANPLALRVKLADIADNSDPERLAALPPEVAERLEEKYRRARALLAPTST